MEGLIETDILVIGGRTAGTVAAIKAREALPAGKVLLLEKASVKRSEHSASGVWVNERWETTVPDLCAAGDMACVPHGCMLGAFTYGKICGRNAADYAERVSEPLAA